MTLDDPGAIWPALGVLAFIALVLDAAIKDKPGRWGSGAVSGDDTARIVSGGKPKATPRTGAKLVLLLAIAFVLFVLVMGGKSVSSRVDPSRTCRNCGGALVPTSRAIARTPAFGCPAPTPTGCLLGSEGASRSGVSLCGPMTASSA